MRPPIKRTHTAGRSFIPLVVKRGGIGKDAMVRRGILLFAALVLALVSIGAQFSPVQAVTGFAMPAFAQQWQAGEAITPNFWGPLSTAHEGQMEPYRDAPGGQRTIQYFDKGRMESTNGTVTNGLLATEIVTGRIQVGDTSFQPKPPPAIPIAGDPDNAGPTYAALDTSAASLLAPAQQAPTGSLVGTVVAPDGTVTSSAANDGPAAVRIAAFDGPTRHNVPQAFADYRTKAGLPTIGYAIAEPFSTTVKVAGTPRAVLVQIFERRVLTYTADNQPAFQVEMGNIGQHYYQWRYGPTPPATPAATIAPPSAIPPPTGQNGNTAPIRSGVAPTGAGCPIIYPVKGVTQGGVAVYDSPRSATYAATKPQICFISPTDAEAAGYRAIAR
jgi:hypothetical protein